MKKTFYQEGKKAGGEPVQKSFQIRLPASPAFLLS
jgi:hypothetical protein